MPEKEDVSIKVNQILMDKMSNDVESHALPDHFLRVFNRAQKSKVKNAKRYIFDLAHFRENKQLLVT